LLISIVVIGCLVCLLHTLGFIGVFLFEFTTGPKHSWFFLRKIRVFADAKQVRVGGTRSDYSDSFKETLEE
jgi:hypothetical protein